MKDCKTRPANPPKLKCTTVQLPKHTHTEVIKELLLIGL